MGARGGWFGGGGEAQGRIASGAVAGAMFHQAEPYGIPDTPRRPSADERRFERKGVARRTFAQKARLRSCAAALMQWRKGRLRQEIIGRIRAAARTRFSGDVRSVRAADRLGALLHEPTRQHGRRVFLQILIQKSADLLSEVRGVRKPRELVALQSVFRSGEKEFPRRLGWVQGQGEPPGYFWSFNDNATVLYVRYYEDVPSCGKVWKTPRLLEGRGGSLRAGLELCSACEGDYEDPERTAWGESEGERRAREEEGQSDDEGARRGGEVEAKSILGSKHDWGGARRSEGRQTGACV